MKRRFKKKRFNRRFRFDLSKAGKKLTAGIKTIRVVPLLKKASPFIVVCAVILFLFFQSRAFLLRSPIFAISRIELAGAEIFDKSQEEFHFYGLTPSTNIFCLDIKGLSQRLMQDHLEFEQVAISRKLPDTLKVRIDYRKPSAFIKKYAGFSEYEYYPISRSGVILPKEIGEGKQLPLLLGLDLYRGKLDVGQQINSRQLSIALLSLERINESWSIQQHSIEALDVSDYRNISLFLENGVQIKLGSGKLDAKIKRLERILKEASLELDKVKYIDLRFKEIVIGPK